MRTIINPKIFLPNLAKHKATKIDNILLPKDVNDAHLTHEVGTFSDYFDARDVLEELELAGLPLSKVTLIACDGWRCHWLGDLAICDRFEEKLFDGDRLAQDFFRQLFEQGQYLLLFKGTEQDLNLISTIINRHRDCSQVWYF